MKKNIILTFSMAIMGLMVFAQQDDRPAPPPGQRSEQGRPRLSPQERAKQATDKLSTLVKLTPDQYSKVLEANTTFHTQQAALRGEGGRPSEENRGKLKLLNEEKEAKIKTILTAEQWKIEKKRIERTKAKEALRARAENRPEFPL